MSRRSAAIVLRMVAVGLAAGIGVASIVSSCGGKAGAPDSGGAANGQRLVLTYAVEPLPGHPADDIALRKMLSITRRRLEGLGVTDYEVGWHSESTRVVVDLPLPEDRRRIVDQLGSSGQLRFYDWQTNVIPPPKPGEPARPIADQYEAVKKASKMMPTKADVAQATVSGPQRYLFNKMSHAHLAGPSMKRKDLLVDFDGEQPKGSRVITVPRGLFVIAEQPSHASKRSRTPNYYIIHDRPGLTGTEIVSPKQEFDPQTNEPSVAFLFTSEGRKKFHEITRRLAWRGQAQAIPGADPQAFYQTFAVVLDRELLTLPYIDFNQQPDGIDGRTGTQISGGFTIQSARDLAANLSADPLPVHLTLVRQTVEPAAKSG